MRIPRTVVSILILVLTVGSVYSQQPSLRFDHLTRDHGLPSNSVSSIAQDRFGFLWFGTQGGLAKYDGLTMTVFEHEPFNANSLPHDLIQTMFMDTRRDILWIGTYQGLARFDINTEKFVNYSHDPGDDSSLSNDIVTAIAADAEGRLWVGTLGGLNRLDENTGKFTRYLAAEEPGSIVNNTIRALYSDTSGALWVGSYGGLSRYDPLTDGFINYESSGEGEYSLPSPYIMDIAEDPAGRLWLGAWDGGAVRFDPAAERFYTSKLLDNRVYAIDVSADDTLWAATWGGGLIHFVPSTGEQQLYSHEAKSESALSNDVVYSLMYDDADILWIGTNGGGINKLDGRKKNYLRFSHSPDDPDSLSAGKVTTVHRDAEEVLWIGTYNGGLNRYNETDDAMVRYRYDETGPGSLSNDIVNTLYTDSRGQFWIGTNAGLNLYNRERDEFTRFFHDEEDDNSIADDIIYSLQEDTSGNLWIGTYNKGISVYSFDDGSFTHYAHNPETPGSISDNLIYCLYFTGSGEMWAGTNKGLNRFNPDTGTFTAYLHDQNDRGSLAGDSVRVMFEDSRGRLWIGTMSGGLSLYRRGTDDFQNFTKKQGLPDNKIRGIIEDDDGHLWVSTEYGLVIFDPESERFRLVDEDDGVFNKEFHTGHWKDPDGKLYFGGPSGVFVFEDAQLLENNHVPPVYITDVRVYDEPAFSEKPYLYEGRLEISDSDDFISFEFIALDYAAPAKNQYRYMLEGFDESWIFAGKSKTFASYTNLNPGRYTFRVQGSNNDGLWNEEGASFRFRVMPPWWRTWWAFILYAAAFLLLLYLGLELRVKRALEQKVNELSIAQRQLKEAKHRAEAATQAKSDFLAVTSHELRTPLNSIKAIAQLIIKTETHPEHRENATILEDAAESMSEIVNDILDISKIEAGKIKLSPVDFDLHELIEKTGRTFRQSAADKGIEFTVNIAETLPRYVSGDPLRIRQILVNLLGNAVKFTDRGSVVISGRQENGQILFIVSDTGIGIEKDRYESIFYPFEQGRPASGKDYGGSGLGLHICKKLITLMGGTISVESKSGSGSTFTVSLPLPAAEKPAVREKGKHAGGFISGEEQTFNILLIEDNKINARVVAKFLTEWGHTVLTASTAEAGLGVLQKEACDMVLMDVELPGMSGFEAVTKIRRGEAGEGNRNITVIALTGHDIDDPDGYCGTHYLDGCMMKPIDFQKLRDLMAEQRKKPAPG